MAAYIAQICDEIKQVFAGKMKFNVLETFSPHSPYTHQKLETMTLPVPITEKDCAGLDIIYARSERYILQSVDQDEFHAVTPVNLWTLVPLSRQNVLASQETWAINSAAAQSQTGC